MTTLTATPTTGPPPGILLAVRSAPNPPATAYTSNFTSTPDGWTASGTGASLVHDGSGTGYIRLLGPTTGTAGDTITASRTVTGLTVSAQYRFRAVLVSSSSTSGQTRQRITSGATGAYVTIPSSAPSVTVDLLFTATATTHVINVDQKRTQTNVGQPNIYIISASVAPSGTWPGTKIYRTDDNGTDIPVRQPLGLDVAAGSMDLLDTECALSGVITYRVVDGSGGTATAITSFAPVTRTNLLFNPSFETNVTGWTGNRATLSKVGAGVSPGTSCLHMVVSDATAAAYAITAAAGTLAMPYTGSTPIQAGYSARPTPGTRVFNGAQVYEYDQAGTLLTPVQQTSNVTCPPDVWTRVEGVLTTKAATRFVRLVAGLSTVTVVGDVWDVDQCYLGPPGTYFDGDTVDVPPLYYQWTGTAHASASVLYDVTPGLNPAPPSLTLPGTVTGALDAPDYAPLTMVTNYEEVSETQGTVHTVLGRVDKLSNPGVLLARTGTLELLANSYPEALAVRELLKTSTVALLRTNNFPGLDLYFVARTVRVVPAEPTPTRRWVTTIDYDEVPPP